MRHAHGHNVGVSLYLHDDGLQSKVVRPVRDRILQFTSVYGRSGLSFMEGILAIPTTSSSSF